AHAGDRGDLVDAGRVARVQERLGRRLENRLPLRLVGDAGHKRHPTPSLDETVSSRYGRTQDETVSSCNARENAMDADVVVVGAGPVGLLLAAELALAGVRPIVLERLDEPSHQPKARG